MHNPCPRVGNLYFIGRTESSVRYWHYLASTGWFKGIAQEWSSNRSFRYWMSSRELNFKHVCARWQWDMGEITLGSESQQRLTNRLRLLKCHMLPSYTPFFEARPTFYWLFQGQWKQFEKKIVTHIFPFKLLQGDLMPTVFLLSI